MNERARIAAENLRNAIKSGHWTPQSLADAAGVDSKLIYRWLQKGISHTRDGKTGKAPLKEVLEKLKIPLEDLWKPQEPDLGKEIWRLVEQHKANDFLFAVVKAVAEDWRRRNQLVVSLKELKRRYPLLCELVGEPLWRDHLADMNQEFDLAGLDLDRRYQPFWENIEENEAKAQGLAEAKAAAERAEAEAKAKAEEKATSPETVETAPPVGPSVEPAPIAPPETEAPAVPPAASSITPPAEPTPTAEKTLSPEKQKAFNESYEQAKKKPLQRAPGGHGLDGMLARVKSKKAAENSPAPTPERANDVLPNEEGSTFSGHGDAE